MKQAIGALFGVAIAAVVLSDPAFAQQTRPERPYRGLFASDTGSNMEQSLTLTGSVGAGYDTSVLANAGELGFGGNTQQRESQNGGFALVSQGLAYTLNKTRFSVSASQSADVRYYPTVDSVASSYGGGVGASWSPSTRTRFSADQTFSYQPLNNFSLFPEFYPAPLGEAFIADLSYGAQNVGYYSYSTGVHASRQLSSRAAISADYLYDGSDFSGVRPNFSSHGGHVRFTRGLSAGLGLRIGYGYTRANYGGVVDQVGRHSIDTGLDYNKTFSFSRRTTLSFSTGGSATKDQFDTHFDIIGTANLNHEIGRTWNFNTAYNRNVGFVETFATPIVYDAVNVGLSGLIGRTVSFHSGGGATFGNLGLNRSAENNGYTTYYASAGLGRALNRHVNLGVNYSFYSYDFEQSPLLPSGFTTDMGRHTVSVSVSAWLPLMQR